MSVVSVLGGGISGLSAAYYLSKLAVPNFNKVVICSYLSSDRHVSKVLSKLIFNGCRAAEGGRSFVVLISHHC